MTTPSPDRVTTLSRSSSQVRELELVREFLQAILDRVEPNAHHLRHLIVADEWLGRALAILDEQDREAAADLRSVISFSSSNSPT